MNDHTDEPADDAGIEAIRLDADRTRDELQRTLTEIEERLNPHRMIARAKRAWNENPAEVVMMAILVVGAIGSLVFLGVRGRR